MRALRAIAPASSLLAAALVLWAAHRPAALGAAQDQPAAGDGIAQLITRFERALDSRDPAAGAAAFAPGATAAPLGLRESATPALYVVRERDRRALPGSSDIEAQRVVVEVLEDASGRGRVITAALTVERPTGGDAGAWRITEVEDLGALEGLYRLHLDTSSTYSARDLVIVAPDLRLTLAEGMVFPIASADGVTGAVLIGRGRMEFTPSPESERGQVRLYTGTDTLTDDFESALIRFSPLDRAGLLPASALEPARADPRAVRRAEEIAARELPRSFAVELGGLGGGDWHLLPASGDLVAEIRTRRRGALTFSRIAAHAEDVSLTRRDRSLIIALYRSSGKVAASGRWYSDDDQREYDVIDYDVEASVSPRGRTLRGRARVSLRMLASVPALTLRLADNFTVSSISLDGGALGFVRLRNQHAVYVRLPKTLPVGATLTLTVSYAGPVESQPLDNESIVDAPRDALANLEPHLLQSSISYWYPQNPFTDYATATLRITVPGGYTCLATGRRLPAPDSPQDEGVTFAFRADLPVQYLAFVVSRFSRIDPGSGDAADVLPVDLAIYANPLIRSRARESTRAAERILRFYTTLVGEAPYPTLEIGVVEAHAPGGHSPAHFVLLRSPLDVFNLSWRDDPAAFLGYADFFLAHELAHQWWGQAVGANSYHETWISEGFAQYFSALYAQEAHGEGTFENMLRRFRRWGLDESANGPVHLGRRLGQIEGDPYVLRALVYNKGALVLHMLRRITGDEVFFRALRGFYERHRFGTAGTEDLRRAFELESGRSLERFFERWIHEDAVPTVTYSTTIADDAVTVRLEQQSEQVFDLPVTVTLTAADGPPRDEVIVMSDRTAEARLATPGRVRRVDINRDGAALAEFRERRN